MFALISVIVTIMTALVVMIMVMMQINSGTSEPIPLMFTLPIVLLIGIDLSFIYSAFVGRSMRKEREDNL